MKKKYVESGTVCLGLGLLWSVKNQTFLIFFTNVTNPLLPLPTNFPVSDFLRPPETHIDTILCFLRCPGTFKPRTLSPRRPGLSPGPQHKSAIDV